MARLVQVVDSKSGRGVEHQLEAGAHGRIAVAPASSIRIKAPTDEVASFRRDGDDLVIEFADGTSLRLDGYFDCTPETANEVLFVDGEGQMWRTVIDGEMCFPAEDAAIEKLTAVFEPISQQAGAAASGWGWTGWALAGAGVADLTTTADSNGNWTVSASTPVPDGRVVQVTAVDATGNASSPTQTTVDATPPAKPVVTANDGAMLSGTAEPGSTVSIDTDGDGVPDAQVTAGEDGSWSVTFNPPLAEGTVIDVTATDAAGNTSTPTRTSVNNSVPTMGTAGDDVGPVTGPLSSGDVTDDKRPTFSGSGAKPNGQVNVYDNGTLIGTATADADGNWSFTPPRDLGEGTHEITFTNIDAYDTEGPHSAPFTLKIDTTAPTSAPTVSGATDDVAPKTGTVNSGEATNDPRPTFAGGGAEPNSTVNIYDNGVLIGTVPVDANGNWTFTPESDLDDGAHSITFSNVDAAGNEGPQSAPFTITVDTEAPTTAPTVDPNALDDVGWFQGTVSDGGLTDDTRPTFSGGGGRAELDDQRLRQRHAHRQCDGRCERQLELHAGYRAGRRCAQSDVQQRGCGGQRRSADHHAVYLYRRRHRADRCADLPFAR